MKVVIINQEMVKKMLSFRDCIEVVEASLKALSKGEALLPLRMAVKLPQDNILGIMPAYSGNNGLVGAKVITVFPKNHGTELDAHQGVVLLFDSEHGCLRAIVDATAITGIRTASASAAAARALSKKNAGDLAIIGAGTQARAHLEAMLLIRKISRVRVWSIYRDEADVFARRESARLGVKVEAMRTSEEAVEGADLICTATTSPNPVLLGKWISDGAHITAIGSCSPQARELDTEAIVKSRFFADSRESVLNESGDFIIPKLEGAIDDSHLLGEIGDVLTGKIKGRESEKDITLFKSLGLAVEDLAAAHHVFLKALEKGLGEQVEIGGTYFAK